MKKNFKWLAIGLLFGLSLFVIAATTGLSGIIFDGTVFPEITFGNGETISNQTNGTLSFGAANLLSTGSISTSGSDVYTSGGNVYTSYKGANIQADQVRLGYNVPDSNKAYGNIRIKCWNVQTGGNDISAGDVVVYYTTELQAGTDTVKAATVRLTTSLNGDTGYDYDAYAWVKVTRPATLEVDTVDVWGKDAEGNSVHEKIIMSAADTTYAYSAALFADVDSIKTTDCNEASGNYETDYIFFNAVMACDGANGDLCGVAETAIPDSSGTGWVVVYGPVRATVDAASAFGLPGTHLIGASGGDCVTQADASVDAAYNGDILGYLLEPATEDNVQRLIFVSRK